MKSIPIPPSLAPLRSFDISWVDVTSQRYYLADRSNKTVDVIDAKNNTFIKAISGGFAGVHFNGAGAANNDIAGPNGVVTSGRWLFVTDAPSRVVTIDLTNDQIVSTASTSASPNRADELAYDPASGTLLVINNADDPPFGTLISVNKTNGHLSVVRKIIFDMSHSGFDATNGAEQPVWEAATQRFYVSIPEINCNVAAQCGGKFPLGAIARINPVSGIVDGLFPVQHCQPAGLTLGPKQDLLLGCGVAFDAAGNAWRTTDPNSAAPISVIMDAKNGSIDRMVAGVSGSDEVWFNSGDGRYYLAARNQPGGPVLGVIDARSQKLTQVTPTVNAAGVPFVFPAGTAHSVAANARNNEVFVPLPANNVFPQCLNGCIAVYAAPNDDHHEGHH
ncbi:MAG TPA: hypothetical protein VHP37_32415 [Burkholderiales bacterium]|nr:hypothetical protein [Burkholderiales bacterium]